jgi:hypothetical protein
MVDYKNVSLPLAAIKKQPTFEEVGGSSNKALMREFIAKLKCPLKPRTIGDPNKALPSVRGVVNGDKERLKRVFDEIADEVGVSGVSRPRLSSI